MFWLVPSLCVIAAIGLGIGMVILDRAFGPTQAAFLFPGPPAGARTFLSAIVQAMITFTGLVFSITILVLQLTSGQFSPRVLRTFLRDRTIQYALGIFVATFVYAMVVLREVRGEGGTHDFVPRIAITFAFLLVLLSVATFIRYVAHIANMIRLASIVDSIGREARKHLQGEHRREHREHRSGDWHLETLRRTVRASQPGVLVAINERELVRELSKANCQLVLVVRIGDYLPAGGPLMRLHGPGDIDDWNLLGCTSFASERTLEQDLAFSFRQLVDIAQRALSPGINDPTTAVQAIDVEHDLLRRLAARPPQSGEHVDEQGEVRLVVPVYDFADYLDLAIGQIWPYATNAVQVPERFRAMLADLSEAALPENREAIQRWTERVSDIHPDQVVGSPVPLTGTETSRD